MISFCMETKNRFVIPDACLKNDTSVESFFSSDPHESKVLKSLIGDVITEPATEQHRKGPRLASSEDQDNMEDDEGFIVAHNPRYKKKRKARASTQCREENVDDSIESKCDNHKTKDELEYMAEGDEKLDHFFEYVKANIPELTKTEFQSVLQKLETENKSNFGHFSEVEVHLKIVELRKRAVIQTPEKTKRKQAWSNIPQNQSPKIIELGECPICFTSVSKNRVVLEECGHCFHSECIRLWMKQKKTCPFCAGFSLLPDEYPRLS